MLIPSMGLLRMVTAAMSKNIQNISQKKKSQMMIYQRAASGLKLKLRKTGINNRLLE